MSHVRRGQDQTGYGEHLQLHQSQGRPARRPRL